MKILLANMYYYPNMIGGAEHSVKLLAEGLQKAGNEVAVVSLDGTNNKFNKEVINDVIVYRGYCKSIYRRRILKDKSHSIDKVLNGVLSIYNPGMNRYFKKAINDFKPDIVHTNNLVTMSYWVWEYCRKQHIGLAHTLRDYWLLDPTTRINGTKSFAVDIFRFVMRKKCNLFYGIVVAPSKSTLSIFESYNYFRNTEKRCIVNCIGLDKDTLNNSINRKIHLSTENVSFLYAGYLSENKGIKQLLAEFVMCKNENISLVVCGDGPLFDEVKAVAAYDHRIQVRGKLDSKLMKEEYNKADVLIVPSLWQEPFGRTVIEAAQYGTITIGSNKGGIPETVTNIAFGSCYDSDVNGALYELIKFYSKRKNIKQLLTSGPKNLEEYNLEHQVNNYLHLYNNILEMK